MRHLCPELCGSEGGSPVGGTQSMGWTLVPPGGGEGELVSAILAVLAGLFGAITSAGLPTHTSTRRLSSPTDSQVPWAFWWVVTSMVLCWPGSALSGPEVAPVRRMSGLSQKTPPPLCTPPSPETASRKKHVSRVRPGS